MSCIELEGCVSYERTDIAKVWCISILVRLDKYGGYLYEDETGGFSSTIYPTKEEARAALNDYIEYLRKGENHE